MPNVRPPGTSPSPGEASPASALAPLWSVPLGTSTGTVPESVAQPVILHNLGLVITGTAEALYLARLTNPGAGPYTVLPSIRAEVHFDGWTVDGDFLYVVDGPWLSRWNLLDGTQTRAETRLAEHSDADLAALRAYRDALQLSAWAELLAQAETVRAESPEAAGHAGLETLRVDLRTMLGSSDPHDPAATPAALEKIRKNLEEKRAPAAPLQFSAPAIRRNKLERPEYAVFVMQGNGTLHTFDASLRSSRRRHLLPEADRSIALLEENARGWLAVTGRGTLYCFDAGSLDEAGRWTPDAPAGETSTLLAARGQFWWGTAAALHALEPDSTGIPRLTWRSLAPGWSGRQVGTHPHTDTPFGSFDRNALFEAMNVDAWIDRCVPAGSAPSEGALAQLLTSDPDGSYQRPPGGMSYVVQGPFASGSPPAGAAWGASRVHTTEAMTLLSGSHGTTGLCTTRADTPLGRLPIWGLGRWFYRAATDADLRAALASGWPGFQGQLPGPAPDPEIRPFGPKLDSHASMLMVRAAPEWSINWILFDLATAHMPELLSKLAPPQAALLRCRLWFGIAQRSFHSPANLRDIWNTVARPMVEAAELAGKLGVDNRQFLLAMTELNLLFNGPPGDTVPGLTDVLNGLSVLYEPADLATLQSRFRPDERWDVPEGLNPLEYAATPYLRLPFQWQSTPLFRHAPPEWSDPWGLNGPADFCDAPPGSFFDLFRSKEGIAFPQRPVSGSSDSPPAPAGLETFAVFTTGDPAVRQADTASGTARETAALPAAGPRAPVPPRVLVVTADGAAQRTWLHLLPCARQRVAVDHGTGALESPGLLGYAERPVVGPPTVLTDPEAGLCTACCVTAAAFPAARVRSLVLPDAGGRSPWDRFRETCNAPGGPPGGGAACFIKVCSFPSEFLTPLRLEGYQLPLG